MLGKLFSVTMVMLTGHLIYGLPMGGKARNPRESCTERCPAGHYLSNCGCKPCNPGFFTNKTENRETSCFRCFQGCKPENYMEEVKACTLTSDVQCRCQKGYVCTLEDSVTSHCKRCIPVTTPIQSPTHTTTGIPLSTTFSKEPIARPYDNLAWILFPIFIILSLIVLALFLQFCRKKEEECFKQIVRQCSLGAEVNSETTPPSQPEEQFHAQEMLSHISTPTNHNTDCFHQPISSEQAVPPAGNLGPLHIYGPQTVFVSLLNQFGWDGGKKKAHELQQESLNNGNMSYPQSPPVHLSAEERNGESDCIFFPSQEQGKESHISKEEVL